MRVSSEEDGGGGPVKWRVKWKHFPFLLSPFPSAFSFYNRLTVAPPHFPLLPHSCACECVCVPKAGKGGPKKGGAKLGRHFLGFSSGFLVHFWVDRLKSTPLHECPTTVLHEVKANFRLEYTWRKALRKYHSHNVFSLLQCNEVRNI